MGLILVQDHVIKSQSATVISIPLVTVFTILCLNLLPLFFFFHRAPVLLSGLFILFFSWLLLYPNNKRWSYGYTHGFKILIQNKVDAFYFIAPFFILPFFWNISPTILFFKFDFYTKVIISWFIFSVIWLNKYYAIVKDKTDYRSIAFYFFIFASCSLWLQLLWKIGAEYVVYTSISTHRFNRLAQAFYYIWEHRPFSSHFLVSFQSIQKYNDKIAYAGYSPPFLLLMYFYSKILAFLLGVTLELTTRVISIFYSIIFAAVYVFTLINNPNKSPLNNTLVQFSVFCVFGIMLSIPGFWIQLTQDTGTDNVFPLIMYFTLFLFVYVSRQDFTSSWFKFGLLGLCLVVPIHGILMIVTLAFYVLPKEYKQQYSEVVPVLLFAFAVAIVTYLYPVIMIKLLHYHNDSSSFLFRSGLDGDVTYYKNMLQALVFPYWTSFPRGFISELIFLLIAYLIGGKILLKEKFELYENYLFLFFPYLLTFVLWPQVISIHPYLYDYMLELPIFFVACSLVISPQVQQRLRGPFALLFILGLISLLMHNFTMIAQASKAFRP